MTRTGHPATLRKLYRLAARGPYVLNRSRASAISCAVSSLGFPADSASRYCRHSVSSSTARVSACLCRGRADDHAVIGQQARGAAFDRLRRQVCQRRRAERDIRRAAHIVAAELHDHVMKRRQLHAQARQRGAGIGMRMHDAPGIRVDAIDRRMHCPLAGRRRRRPTAPTHPCPYGQVPRAPSGEPPDGVMIMPSAARSLTLPELPTIRPRWPRTVIEPGGLVTHHIRKTPLPSDCLSNSL